MNATTLSHIQVCDFVIGVFVIQKGVYKSEENIHTTGSWQSNNIRKELVDGYPVNLNLPRMLCLYLILEWQECLDLWFFVLKFRTYIQLFPWPLIVKHLMLALWSMCYHFIASLSRNCYKTFWLLNCLWCSTLQFIRFLRRTEGVEPARKYFLDARKSPNCTYHVYVAYAMMAFCLDKDAKVI